MQSLKEIQSLHLLRQTGSVNWLKSGNLMWDIDFSIMEIHVISFPSDLEFLVDGLTNILLDGSVTTRSTIHITECLNLLSRILL